LMDSEVDADIKTLSLPANTTISAFGKTLIDDAAASNARTTLGLSEVACDVYGTASGTVCQGNDSRLSNVRKPDKFSFCLNLCDSDTALEVGDGVIPFVVPATMNGLDLTALTVAAHTAGSSGSTTIQVRRRRSGSNADMLSSLLTLAVSTYSSTTATINTSNDDIATGDQIYFDVDAISTGVKGVSVTLTFS